MYIKEIRIRNFRSIVKADIPLNRLSLFVGLNDVGKSNVLKALNLFFNNETDYNQSFNFSDDYSKNSPKTNKKAQEIIIDVIFYAPTNYNASSDIIWRRVWRKNEIREEKKFLNGSAFPAKSKLPSWLQNIRYSYVPAIRDTNYFQILLAKLHDSLAETIEKDLRDAGDEFIEKIKGNTVTMLSEIGSRLKITSQLKLPANLQSLFKTLDFSTEEGSFEISLSNRGDGIKTRYIPVILKFISDQLNLIKVRGSANVIMIWGYEEPENNLEMLAVFKLAKDFIDYTNNIQILVTTHSPGFYSLKESDNSIVNLFRVSKIRGKEAEIKMLDKISDLNDELGIMPLITPYVIEKVNEIEALKAEIESNIAEMANYDKSAIFVEGKDEERIFNKILEKNYKTNPINVKSSDSGCSGVKSHLIAWSWDLNKRQLKALGIFDSDDSGNDQFKELQNDSQFTFSQSNKIVKGIKYKIPKHLINVARQLKGFPIELEEMYSPEIWKIAETKKWLEKRSAIELNNIVTPDSIEDSIIDKINSFNFSEEEKLYILNKIPDKHKDKVSKYIIDNSSDLEKNIQSIIEIFEKDIAPFFNLVSLD